MPDPAESSRRPLPSSVILAMLTLPIAAAALWFSPLGVPTLAELHGKTPAQIETLYGKPMRSVTRPGSLLTTSDAPLEQILLSRPEVETSFYVYRRFEVGFNFSGHAIAVRRRAVLPFMHR